MRRQILLWLLTLVLIGWGSTSPVSMTAAAVHARWVTAVRENDRAAALALVSANRAQREQFVDEALRAIQDLQTAPHSPTGALRGVDVRDPTVQGAGQRGISIWHFERKLWCYQTELIRTDNGWRVIWWGQVAHCP
jgi:hypothetical protein